MTNCLVMPSTFVEVKDEEIEYKDGRFCFLSFIVGCCIAAAAVVTCAAGAATGVGAYYTCKSAGMSEGGCVGMAVAAGIAGAALLWL